MVNKHIFRAYDIRGKAMTYDGSEPDLTPESAFEIACATATYMRRKLELQEHEYLKTVVGRDCRLSSPSLHESIVHGLKSQKCTVVDIGLATSPLVYFATCEKPYDLGLSITASHNHKDDNGIKIIGKNAHSICGDELQAILKIALEHDYSFKNIEKESTLDHAENYEQDENLFERYKIFLHSKFSFPKLSKPLKIVIDTGNGVVGKFMPELLKSFGIEVEELYTTLDGNYPNHEANPEYEENLKDAIHVVKEKKCDIGFGFDGDGDRIGVIDETGSYKTADEVIIVLAKDILKVNPRAKIVFDVKCSLTLQNEIIKAGGQALVERTGHSFIERRMKGEGALLAGEVSGHIFIGENYFGYDDAMFAGVKLAYILARAKFSDSQFGFSQFLLGVPKTITTPEIKINCKDEEKFKIVERLKNIFEKRYKCLTIDGVKIYFSQTNWGLIRASNTSAYLTLRFEADTQEKLVEIKKITEEELSEALGKNIIL